MRGPAHDQQCDDIDRHRQRHGAQHLARHQCPDEDAVVDPACHADQRGGHQPGQEGPRLGPHIGRRGHQVDQHRPRQKEQRRQHGPTAEAPLHRDARSLTELRQRPRAHRLTHQRLGGDGEAVQCIGGDLQELQQHLIGRQRHVAMPRAQEQEGGKAQLQHDRAQHDVAAGREHPPQRDPVPQPGQRRAQPRAKGIARQEQRKGKPGIFRDQSGNGHPRHAPAQPHDEPQTQDDVQPVLHQLQPQHAPRPLHPDQPTGQGIEGDGRGRPPDADRQILPCQTLDRVAGRGNPEGPGEQQPLQCDQTQPGRPCHGQGAQQDRAALDRVARACGLRRQSRGGHPQKTEDPVHRRQDHRPDAHRPDRRGLPHLADHRRIDRPQKRHRRIRQHDGQRDAHNAGVGDVGHAPVFSGGSGISRCTEPRAKGRSRLSCQASTCTLA